MLCVFFVSLLVIIPVISVNLRSNSSESSFFLGHRVYTSTQQNIATRARCGTPDLSPAEMEEMNLKLASVKLDDDGYEEGERKEVQRISRTTAYTQWFRRTRW